MIEKISTKEKETIEAFIDKYVKNEIHKNNSSNRASIETLLAPWEENKQKFLYDFFDEKLILSKPVNVNKSIDELESDFDSEPYYSPIEQFINEMAIFLSTNYNTYEFDKIVHNLLISENFATNRVPRDMEILNPFTKQKMTFSKGMRLTKALGKIAKEFNLKGFEEFRIRHSQILNEKEISGELCLSIHPLDYMTMSENESGWSSCMDWYDGCYRAGTTEMMNSPMVIVAYLKSKNDMTIKDDLTWNNKKWRELFIVTPEFACGVKGYPYYNQELEDIVLEWLSEISNGRYESNIRQIKHGQLIIDERQYHFHFSTDLMYNDIHHNSSESVCIIICKDSFKNHSSEFYVHYSGADQCMWCGQFCSLSEEDSLTCKNCYCSRHKCFCCEDAYSLDDLYLVDNEYICEYCYEHDTYTCLLTGMRHLKDNSVKLYAVDSCLELEEPDKCNNYILIPLNHPMVDYPPYKKYFTNGVYSAFNKIYVYKHDLTDEGRSVFNIEKLI